MPRPRTISFLFFLFTLIFCPLAFATTELWSMTFAQTLVFISLLFYLIDLISNRKSTWRYSPGALPLLLFCLYILCQTLPVPPSLLKSLSPKAWEIYRNTIWVVAPDTWMPLSVTPKETLNEFFRFASCTTLYVLTIQLLGERRKLKKTLLFIALLAGGVATLAIIQKFSSPQLIYWFRPVPASAQPVGPFIYKNHYAGFMEMLLPLAMALFLHYRPRIRYRSGWRRRIALFLSMPDAHVHILLGTAALFIAVSVFLSLSRGGIICMSLSLIVFVLLLAKNKFSSRNMTFLAILLFTVVLAVGWFGWQPIFERFETTLAKETELTNGRMPVWLDSLNIIKDFPLTGSGFGSFLDIYRAYRTFPGRSYFSHAHNDYIELLTNGGMLAGFLVLCFIFTLFHFFFRTVNQRRDRYPLLMAYGVLAGLLSIFLHSATDFNLQNGANTFYFFLLCGLLVATVTSRPHSASSPFLRISRSPAMFLFILPLLGSGIAAMLLHGGQLQGQYFFSRIQQLFLYEGMPPERLLAAQATATHATSSDPLEPRYSFALANIGLLLKDEKQTILDYTRAVELNPLNCLPLQALARTVVNSNPAAALQLAKASHDLNPQQVDCTAGYVAWLFARNNKKEALQTLREAMLLDASNTSQYYWPIIEKNDLSPDEIVAILPERTEAYIKYAQILWNKGKRNRALVVYKSGLHYLDREKGIKPWHFEVGLNWYTELQQNEEAFELLQLAVDFLPEDSRFHERLGDLYKKQGVLFRALEEYNKASTLDPTNRRIQKKITVLSGENAAQ